MMMVQLNIKGLINQSENWEIAHSNFTSFYIEEQLEEQFTASSMDEL
jgi:hypothetical protein